MKKIFVTGAAGFIGSSFCKKILESTSVFIIAIDNFDSFYEKSIKVDNLSKLLCYKNFQFVECDINEVDRLSDLIENCDCIVHFAAKAGVRPSLLDPISYINVNVTGTVGLLEKASKLKVPKFIFASSSSVYGINQEVPWRESADLMPISTYALSKLAGEQFGKYYSDTFGLNFIALRFFTVYGPSQRPDLAIHKFFKKIYFDECLDVFGEGDTLRDYTYIDDVVDGVVKALYYEQSKFEVFNLGNSNCVSLSSLIALIEETIGKRAIIKYRPEQVGDVPKTYADISKAKKLLGYSPNTEIKEGLNLFFNWFKNTYELQL
jgi:UDP-glucuronate 4-epimerase